jgi:pimeloyl-ACP methyl ester carboxylesterase
MGIVTAAPPVDQLIRAADGRTLAVDVTGAPDGYPVFLLHGTPGSRTGPRPRGILLYRHGIRLISYDRPGYGRSTRHPGRAVRDAAADVTAIADALGVDEFAVVGRSGGGPHALACAAEAPDRVSSAAVLVSLAPSDAHDLEWFEGMNEQNAREYSAADNDTHAVLANLTSWTAEARSDPRRIIDRLVPGMSEPDLRVVGDVAIRRLLTDTYAEALRNGPEGWIDDVLAFRKPWGIDLSAITSRVRLWHGADDRFSPVWHTLWLGRNLPRDHVEVRIQPGLGHFGAMEVLPEILRSVVDEVRGTGRVGWAPAAAPAAPLRTGRADRSPGTGVALPAAT